MKTIKELVYYVLYAMFTMTFMWFLFFYGDTTVKGIKNKIRVWRDEREIRKLEKQREKINQKVKLLMNEE